MKFFISYCDSDVLQIASDAASILEANGHQAWYFDRDKTPGLMLIQDITIHIRYWCDKILFLCTSGSVSSDGQKPEIGHWYKSGKQLIVIPIDVANVPIFIDPWIYQPMSSNNFNNEFDKFVRSDLDRITKRFEELSSKVKDTVKDALL